MVPQESRDLFYAIGILFRLLGPLYLRARYRVFNHRIPYLQHSPTTVVQYMKGKGGGEDGKKRRRDGLIL